MTKLNIAVIYGSRSTEHEVSIISALQVMQNLDQSKYNILPIYISKSGRWISGNKSFLLPETYKNLNSLNKFPEVNLVSKSMFKPKIDIVFPVFHGTFGEDGTIQGLLEMLDLPYVGCGVLASSVGMDKVVQKQVFAGAGISQVKYLWFYRGEKPKINLKFPLFVKPANGGSSIGITKVKNHKELTEAVEVAFNYDRKIIVEESAEEFKEINISVLGNAGSELRTSVCEQPVASKEVLTYQDKYQSNSNKSSGMASAKRLIPAPINPATAAKIAEIAKLAFNTLDCSGLVRVDFLVSPDEKKIYLNEVNTIPGSLAFYLWEKSGLKFPKLLDNLIGLAKERYQQKSQNTYTFSSNILATVGQTLKSGKIRS